MNTEDGRLQDLRRRAMQHSAYGNYWATKCISLIDEIERLKREISAS